MPLRWETDARPGLGIPPQDSINLQIVDHADMVIGVFWTRLGTPTGAADSGTVEEIDRAGEDGKPVMLYFSRAPVDPETLDLDEYARLADFRQRTYPRGLVEKYTSLDEFRRSLTRHLAMQVRDIIQETATPPALTHSIAVPELALAVLDGAGTVVPGDPHFFVSRIKCVNEDDIPAYVRPSEPTSRERVTLELVGAPNADYYVELIRWYQKFALTVTFKLAMVNNGETAAHDLHLDTRFAADIDGSSLTTDRVPRPSSLSWPSGSNIFFPDITSNVGAAKRLENLAPGRWALEDEIGVVQVARTLQWGPALHWRVTQPGTLTITCTVYSSDAPPFILDKRLTVEIEDREMTYQDILAAMGVEVEAPG